MTHKEYVALGRELATTHKDILHTEQAKRFVRMHLSSDPYQAQLDMKEFLTSLRNTKVKLDRMLVWISYEGKYEDNRSDNKIKLLLCSFMVLQTVKRDDWEAQDDAYAQTEQIGEELLAAIMHTMYHDRSIFIDPDSFSSEKIGPLPGDLHGTKFTYVVPVPANRNLYFNPEKFLTA